MSGTGQQLRFGGGAVQNLNLFSDHFLRERLPEWTEYATPDVEGLVGELLSAE